MAYCDCIVYHSDAAFLMALLYRFMKRTYANVDVLFDWF